MVKKMMNKEFDKEGVSHNSNLLNIDFDLHTDGDAEFKLELIELMINNVRELQWSVRLNAEVFKKVCHKIKSTVIILGCDILNGLIADLNDEDLKDRWSKTHLLSLLCDDIVKSLEEERK